MQARTTPARHGLAWIIQAYTLYRKKPSLWALVVLFYFMSAATLSASWLQPIGSVALSLLGPIFVAGFLTISQKITYRKDVEFKDLFIGFKVKTPQLVTLGGVMLLGFILITLLMALIGGLEQMESLYAAMQSKDEALLKVLLATPSVQFAVFMGILLNAVLAAAYWFATALVFFQDAKPLQAMYLSLVASMRNMLAMLVYFVVGLGAFLLLMVVIALVLSLLGTLLQGVKVLFVLVSALVGIGFLVLSLAVLFPILLNTLFVSYEDIFSITTPVSEVIDA